MLFKAFKNPLYTMFFNERKEKKAYFRSCFENQVASSVGSAGQL